MRRYRLLVSALIQDSDADLIDFIDLLGNETFFSGLNYSWREKSNTGVEHITYFASFEDSVGRAVTLI